MADPNQAYSNRHDEGQDGQGNYYYDEGNVVRAVDDDDPNYYQENQEGAYYDQYDDSIHS